MRRLLFAVVLILSGAACGPSRPATCAEITDKCECYRADCQVVVDTCFCPNECGANVQCACGGGAFLRCEDKP